MAFDFGGAAASNPAPAAPFATNQQQQQQQQQPQQNGAAGATLTIPPYRELFPGQSVSEKVGSMLRESKGTNEDGAHLAGQFLVSEFSSCSTAGSIAQRLLMIDQDPTLQPVQPDLGLRQRLSQNPTVLLPILQNDGTERHQEASLTHGMLEDVKSIADDLQISEVAAISLYQRAAARNEPFHCSFVKSCLQGTSISVEHSAAWSAREIFFHQRPSLVKTCQQLLKLRLEEGDSDSNFVCQATDALLKNGWIQNIDKLVRKYTQRIDQLLNAYSNTAGGNIGTTTTPRQFWQGDVTLQCYYEERQIAVECLFFIAYHVQLTVKEVGILIDLVRDLSNANVVLDPLFDVPNPFFDDPASAMGSSSTTASWFTQFPRREKDPLAWQQELVKSCWKTGQPQLMRCYCTVAIAVVSALGNRTVLMDRNTHSPNSFGTGNALLPPGSTSVESLTTIYNCLNKDATNGKWERKDVLGLLMGAYAILLRSSPSAMSSPRASGVGSPRGSGIDVRKTLRECLEAPAKQKSFTFARLCMIPALKKPKLPVTDEVVNPVDVNGCDVGEFRLAVLAEFGAQFLDLLSASGEAPISRFRWEQEKEDDLQIRRDHQQKQRDFHGQFAGQYGNLSPESSTGAVPSAVDLLERPDCIDDIIAFATAICSLGSAYVLPFWTQEEHVSGVDAGGETQEILKLVPSRALKDLERQSQKDDSLDASYLSFLAALALAKNPMGGDDGAAVIHSMLSSATGNRNKTSWSSVMEMLRLYIHELDPQSYTSSSTSSKSNASATSTAYYYFDQEDLYEQSSNAGRQNGDGSATPRPLELGQTSTFHLMSHLAIIANVATHSPAARKDITTMNIQVQNSDKVVGQDSALMILFILSRLRLKPELRGAVFETLATLLSVDDCTDEEASEMRAVAAKGWELLEHCQIIPISILEQYPSPREAGAENTTPLLFPLSSTSVAADSGRRSWIDADQRYAILYEMEFVESAIGYYPSTEGFLRLLASLFTAGGSPSSVGQGFRTRPGCSPYIEYVLSFVLPRALGSMSNLPTLPFRSTNDKSRLLALALGVIEAVLFRYVLPVPGPVTTTQQAESTENLAERFYKVNVAAARDVIYDRGIVKSTVHPPHAEDVKFSQEDFFASSAAKGNQATGSAPARDIIGASQSAIAESSAPRPKTPGFTVLASLLSISGELFSALATILVEEGDHVHSDVSKDVLELATALYGNTPPVFTKAKEATGKRTVSFSTRQSLLESLRPTFHSNTALHWGTQTILSALRILCAAFARENLFGECLNAAHSSKVSIVPVLSFEKSKRVPKVVDVQPSKLSHLLLSSDAQSGTLGALLRLVGFVSTDEQVDVDIAAAAITTLFCTERALPRDRIGEILGNDPRSGQSKLVLAFNNRFIIAGTRAFDRPGIQMIRSVLDNLLRDLRVDRLYGESIANLLFRSRMEGTTSEQDCLDSLLVLSVFASDFSADPFCAALASSCYEIVYHLTKLSVGGSDVKTSLYIAERLGAVDFWKLNLQKMFSSISSPDRTCESDLIHAMAWLLKGVAGELHRLSGYISLTSSAYELVVAPNPGLYKTVCQASFSDGGFVEQALLILPIEKVQVDHPAVQPDLQAVSRAKEENPIFEGYATINVAALMEAEKAKGFPVDEDRLRVWATQWNHQVVGDCTSAHLSDAIHTVVGAFACTSKFFELSPHFVAGDELLVRILDRMSVGLDPSGGPCLLDDTLYTTACRNLSSAALSCCHQGKRTGDSSDSVTTVIACSLLARAITCSGNGDSVGPDSSRRNERIAYLASSLLLLLKDLSDQAVTNRLLRDENISYFQGAAVVLSNLSCNVVVSQIPAVPTDQALVARTCLHALLEVLEAESSEHSWCREILTNVSNGFSQSPLQSMIQLIPLLEEHIATLLQSLVFFPEVPSLLVQYRVLQELENAADTYVSEEAKFIPSERHNYGQLAIGTPAFLSGHLGLLGALMAAMSSSGQDERREIALKVISVIRKYQSVFERLCATFPLDGDVLKAMIGCLAQADNLISGGNSAPMDQYGRVVNEDALGLALRSKIVAIALHIAEYPLPEPFFGQLPSRLRTVSHGKSGVVVVSTDHQKSWWDAVEANDKPASGTSSQDVVDGIFENALHGATLVRYGLQLCRGSELLLSLDNLTLLRALFRCSNAGMLVEDRLRSLPQAMLAAGADPSNQEPLFLLRSKFAEIVADLLRVLLLQVNAVNSGRVAVRGGPEAFCQNVAYLLDITSLEAPGVWESNENSLSYIASLAQALRKATQ